MTFKWKKDGMDLPAVPGYGGVATSRLKISNIMETHDGLYTVEISTTSAASANARATASSSPFRKRK